MYNLPIAIKRNCLKLKKIAVIVRNQKVNNFLTYLKKKMKRL